MRRFSSVFGSPLFAILGFLVLAVDAEVRGQTLESFVRLEDGDPLGIADHPFGVTLERFGKHGYVAISGNYGGPPQNNRRLVKFDVRSRDIVAEATVGDFPEDIALTYEAQGAVRHLFVSCSSSSSVVVLTPWLQQVASISLATCGGFGQYPFGVAASADGTRVVVSTLAGCGSLFVIDADPASPAFATVIATHTVPGGHGRPVWVGTRVLVPSAVYGPSFAGSQATIGIVDPAPSGGLVAWSVLTPYVPGQYIAAIDSALLPSGNILLTVNGEPLSRLYEVDPILGLIVRTIPLGAPAGSAVHGLAVRSDGRVAVVTSQDTNRVLFVDLLTSTVLADRLPLPVGQPNEAAFTRDESRVFVTLQGSNLVAVYRDLPLHELVMAAPATAQLGVPATFSISGGQWESPIGVLASFSAGSGTLGGAPFFLAAPFFPLVLGRADPDGQFQNSFVAPVSLTWLHQQTLHLQAATMDASGQVRTSLPTSLVVL